MNVFYCNGFISIIVASALMRKNFSKQENILFIEKDRTRVFLQKGAIHSDEYDDLVKLLASCSSWDEIREVNINTSFFQLKDLLIWPLNKLIPFKYFRFLRNKNRKIDFIRGWTGSLQQHDKLIVSDNSILGRYLYNGVSEFSFIEHGASSYNSGVEEARMKKILLCLSSFFSVKKKYNSNSIYLSDGGMCEGVRRFDKNKVVRSISVQSDIRAIFEYFFDKYSMNYKKECQELCDIREKYIDRRIYVYLPTAEVSENEYEAYLKLQLGKINLENSVFLVKSHKHDNRGNDYYLNIFESLGVSAIDFNKKINPLLPVELMLFFFSNMFVFGSYTSAHLYSSWWLDRESFFVKVDGSNVNEYLMNEYRNTHGDFKKL